MEQQDSKLTAVNGQELRFSAIGSGERKLKKDLGLADKTKGLRKTKIRKVSVQPKY
ncbi:MAG: hypothetical protein ACE5IW_05680 [bacterium]